MEVYATSLEFESNVQESAAYNSLSTRWKPIADLSHYLDVVDLCQSKSAEFYPTRKKVPFLPGEIKHLPYIGRLNVDDAEQQAIAQEAEEFYFFDKLYGTLDPIKDAWGEEYNKVLPVYRSLKDEADVLKLENIEKASQRRNRDLVSTAIRAAAAYPALNETQRIRLLSCAGYTAEELSSLKLIPKLGTSMLMSAAIAYGYEAAGFAAAGYGAFLNPLSEGLTDPKTLLAVLGSYGLYYSSMAWGINQNVRMLRNKNINFSPNGTATATYYFLDKLLPKELEKKEDIDESGMSLIAKGKNRFWRKVLSDRESTINWATRVASLGWEIPKEIGWAGSILINPNMIFFANLAGAGLNVGQALIEEAIIRFNAEKEEKDSKVKK